MILTEIQSYLAKQGKASLAELAIYFRSDTNAIRPMLKRLIRKGRIRLMNNQKCCGCTSCTPESLEFYEWIN
jgi:predicted ArsR family transcriptional regulator